MKVLFEFARARPLANFGLLLCLAAAGLVEGLGLSAVIPLVGTAIRAGAATADPTGIEARLLDALRGIGFEPTLGVLLATMLGAFALKAGLLLFVRRQVGFTIERVVGDLRLRLLRALLRADWRFYVDRPIGSFTNSFVTEANRAGAAYLQATWVVFRSLQLVVYAGLAFATSWQVAGVALTVSLGLALGLGGLVSAGRRAGARQTRLLRLLLGRLTDLLQAVKPLKAMGRAEAMMPLLERKTRQVQRARQKQLFVKEALAAVQEPLVVAFLGAGLFVGIVWLEMPLPRVLLLAVLSQRAYSAINHAQRRYQRVAIDESAYWALRSSIDEAEARVERAGGGARVGLDDAIAFDAVGFRYDAEEVLRDATLEIPAGRVTALVGPSGAGKTTIVDLVSGLIHASDGAVRIDGVPLEEIDLAAWRRSIGYVPQDAFLLNDTIHANVTLGDQDLSDADVERALRDAHAWDFVRALPDGTASRVGERGLALSGGQRQRISIARALVHRPALLILDEATTALDPSSEAAVLAAVEELRGRTTVLAVSHQPALMQVADRVYEVRQGRAQRV
ncbi:MAG: ABC transporter ATP-binding protein, partial [Myxococcales bacterium]|nr:ABC transporter ATP-binding protein [Myxococcales bacterium]